VTTKIYASGGAAVTVRDPDADGFQVIPATMGSIVRCLDGTARQHALAVKRAWDLKWSGLTTSEYTALLAQLSLGALLDFVAPDGATVYNVLVVGDVQAPSDGHTYQISARLEQV
jgi:hypothetical protein